jgi:hypothetical protein
MAFVCLPPKPTTKRRREAQSVEGDPDAKRPKFNVDRKVVLKQVRKYLERKGLFTANDLKGLAAAPKSQAFIKGIHITQQAVLCHPLHGLQPTDHILARRVFVAPGVSLLVEPLGAESCRVAPHGTLPGDLPEWPHDLTLEDEVGREGQRAPGDSRQDEAPSYVFEWDCPLEREVEGPSYVFPDLSE